MQMTINKEDDHSFTKAELLTCTLPGSEPDLQVGYERPKIKCSGVGAASKKLTVIDLSISAESLLSTAFLITAFDRQIVVFFPAACMWDL